MALIKYNDPFSMMDNFFSNSKIPSVFEDDWLESRFRGGKMELKETEKELRVKAPVYGVSPEDVDVTVKDGVLTIKGSAKKEDEKGEKTIHSRMETEFFYQTTLPREVEDGKTTAKVKNGVVTVTIPKSEGSKGKKIKVIAE